MKQITDLEKLETVFRELGIPYSRTSEYPRDNEDFLINIGEGVGYTGFYAEFYFDKAGKFKEYGVWE